MYTVIRDVHVIIITEFFVVVTSSECICDYAVMKRQKTSDIWSQFTADEREKMASCHICKQTLSYKTSITNLKRHLSTKHPTYSMRLSETLNKPTSISVNVIDSRQNLSLIHI